MISFQNGLLSGLPNFSRFVVAVLFSWLVDSLLEARKCSVTFARKMATCICMNYSLDDTTYLFLLVLAAVSTYRLREPNIMKGGVSPAMVLPALLFLMMGRLGCNGAAEVALLTAIAGIGGCASSGSIVNSVDIAPNFAGE